MQSFSLKYRHHGASVVAIGKTPKEKKSTRTILMKRLLKRAEIFDRLNRALDK